MARPDERDAALAAVERRRQLELDSSQVELARRTDALLAEEQGHGRLGDELEAAHGILRALTAPGQDLSTDALRFGFHRGRVQAVALHEAAASVEKARELAADERRVLERRLEDVRVIERLRGRRARARAVERRRRAQARLDELAIIKSWNGEDDTWR